MPREGGVAQQGEHFKNLPGDTVGLGQTPRPVSAQQNGGLRARSGDPKDPRSERRLGGSSDSGSCTVRARTESSLRPIGFYDPEATTPP